IRCQAGGSYAFRRLLNSTQGILRKNPPVINNYSQSDTIPEMAISQSRSFVMPLLAIPCIVGIAILIISFNGGIGVGTSNHAGLLPVVRRILNPDYLPGD